MDVLKDKNIETFDYVCRYSTVPFYYHTLDDKYIYGIGTQIEKENISNNKFYLNYFIIYC